LIVGLTDADRKDFKRQLLEVTPQKLSAVVERYFTGDGTRMGTAVIAGADQLEKANTQLADSPLKLQAI
jgi:Zn-dependent M16 (insulinase) family peptidase